VPAFEAAVCAALAEPSDNVPPAIGTSGSSTKINPSRTSSSRRSIGEALELALTKNVFEKLMRYEVGLMNQLRVTLNELRHLSYERAQAAIAAVANKKEPPAPPEANAAVAWKKFKLG
jgi:hypothetical protein